MSVGAGSCMIGPRRGSCRHPCFADRLILRRRYITGDRSGSSFRRRDGACAYYAERDEESGDAASGTSPYASEINHTKASERAFKANVRKPMVREERRVLCDARRGALAEDLRRKDACGNELRIVRGAPRCIARRRAMSDGDLDARPQCIARCTDGGDETL